MAELEALRNLLNNEQELTKVSDQLFDDNDNDKSGFIEKGEFGRIVNDFAATFGLPAASDSEINEIIASLDSNNDGKFNKKEFNQFIRLLLEALLAGLSGEAQP